MVMPSEYRTRRSYARCVLVCVFVFSSRRRHTRCLSDWSSDVCSSDLKEGIAEVWRMVLDHRELLEGNGFLAQLRNLQALQWMNELTMLGLEELFRRDRAVAERLPLLREEVHGGRM